MRALILLAALLLSGCGGSTNINEPFVPIRPAHVWEPVYPDPLPYYGPPVEPVRWRISRGCCVRAY